MANIFQTNRVVKNIYGALGAKLFFIIILCTCGACRSLYMAKLPIETRVVEDTTASPVVGASVELVWRVGFGGIIWGKSVTLKTDENGVVEFTRDNVPALDELGGNLDRDLNYVMVDRLLIEAQGYEPLYYVPSRSRVPPLLELKRQE
ncbi:MAG: hypothetical protein JW951_05695 [Lentisphaerae bacterium]|nr:hypothetical protein [Lentisphaerota bacterium]